MFSRTAKNLCYNNVSKYYFTKIIDISKKKINAKLNKINNSQNKLTNDLTNDLIRKGWYYR